MRPPHEWLTLSHAEVLSNGCKDRFNRIWLEDLSIQTYLRRGIYTCDERPVAQECWDLLLDEESSDESSDESSEKSS